MCVCPRSFSCCCGRALPTRFLPRERSCCASETTPQPRTVQRVLLWSYRLMPPTPTPPQRLNQLNNDIHPPKMRNYCFASLTRTMPTLPLCHNAYSLALGAPASLPASYKRKENRVGREIQQCSPEQQLLPDVKRKEGRLASPQVAKLDSYLSALHCYYYCCCC